jgi:hypothetical protein
MKLSPTATKQKKCQLYIYLNEKLKTWCVREAARHNPPLSVSKWVAWQLETIKKRPGSGYKKRRIKARSGFSTIRRG